MACWLGGVIAMEHVHMLVPRPHHLENEVIAACQTKVLCWLWL